MRLAPVLLALAGLSLAWVVTAYADEGPRFHRTTPRGSFGRDGVALLVGVPDGRAWGVESELRAVPPMASDMRVELEVSDPRVREAFVRVAFYDRWSSRPRQIAVADAPAVRSGERLVLSVSLDPPPTAVAYRVRVLARVFAPSLRSAPEAVRAVLGPVTPREPVPPSRLLR
jgi:hypothetical protein